MRRKDLMEILNDFNSHVVQEEYRREPTHIRWACDEGYMTWFYRISYSIMTLDATKEPPKPTN